MAHRVIRATQRFGRLCSEADTQRVALTKPDLQVRALVDAGEEVRAAVRQVSVDESAAILDHSDQYPEPFDSCHDLALEGAVAIHVCRRNEEIGMGPIARPLQTGIGLLLEREPLAAHTDQITTSGQLVRGGLGPIEEVFEVADGLGHDVDPVVGGIAP